MNGKLTHIATIVFICLTTSGFAQLKLNIGAGYYSENFNAHGAKIEFEIERPANEFLSATIRTNLGFFANSDYTALFLDEQLGFRRSFKTGLFFEQSIGIGVFSKSYSKHMFYYDKHMNSIPHGNKQVWSFMPSVSIGVGTNLTVKKEKQNLIWLRPKLYWDLGLRGLERPFTAVQLGYTHTFKY